MFALSSRIGMPLLLLLSFFACVPLATNAQVPIPHQPHGFLLSANQSLAAPIQLEIFVDLLCPNSAAAWPAMDSLLQVYTPDTLALRVHAFPLPYHTWSFIANQGLYVIDSHYPASPSHLQSYIHLLFQVQSNYWNAITAKKNRIEISAALAKDVVESGKFDQLTKKHFVDGLKDEDLDGDLREGWKYSASRGVVGTPQWLLNGVAIDEADASWGIKQWKRVIDGLLRERANSEKKRKEREQKN